MDRLDPRSLIVAAGVLSLVCTVLIFMMVRSFPPTIRGIRSWGVGCLLCLLSSPFFALRDIIPDFWSVVVANAFLLGGLFFQFAGLSCFTGRQVARRVLISIWVGLLAIVAWYTLAQPDYSARQVILGSAFTVLYLVSALRVGEQEKLNYAIWFMRIAYLFIAIVSAARVVLVMTTSPSISGASLLDPNPMQRLYLFMFSMSGLLLTLGFIQMAHEKLHDLLRYHASHDVLSGALNHGAVLQNLDREIASAERHGYPLSILMLDLDHFKQINDQYGHLVGDQVIADFSSGLRNQLRQLDFLGRYGGEEFLVLLPHTNGEGAVGVAERIREDLAQRSSSPKYTVSIGVASLMPGRGAQALLQAADQAMYRAKAAGRNCVVADDAIQLKLA